MMYIVEDVKRQIPINSRLHPTDELHTALKQACVCERERKKESSTCMCISVGKGKNVYVEER